MRLPARHQLSESHCVVLAAGCLLAVGHPLAGSAAVAAQQAPRAPEGSGWRTELTGDLLDPWTRHARDTLHGGFRTHLDRRWRPAGPAEKYPSMLGRHLFSYSAGYLVTGEDRWLRLADSTYRFLVRHGWDGRHGGWFDRLTRAGEPAERSKSTFVQVYVATGLTLYHFVTRRPDVRRRVRRTNRILETRFRDEEHGGYFQQLARDFSVVDSSKTAASQLAPISGHLLYLYAGTRDTALLRQARRLMRNVMRRMRDPETGWIRERFTASWSPDPGSSPESFNVGHNVEVAWLLARLGLTTAGAGYREQALALGDRVAQSGYLPGEGDGEGAWIQAVARPEARSAAPPPDSGRVLWWIQAYGDMTELTLGRIRGGPLAGVTPYGGKGEGAHLRRYRDGTAFWRRRLLDRRFGAAVTAVDPEGRIRDGGKGGRWKTSYHAVEHALWNWLGEALWLPPSRAVTLHFRTRPVSGDDAAERGTRRICPRLVPGPGVAIRSVRRGERTLEVAADAACFRVAADGPPVRVTLDAEPGGTP